MQVRANALVCCKTRRKNTPRSAVAFMKEVPASKMRSRVPLGDVLPHAEVKLQDALQQDVKKNTFEDFERRMRAMLDQKTEEHQLQNERRAIAAKHADPGPISLGAAITAALSKCVPEPAKVRRGVHAYESWSGRCFPVLFSPPGRATCHIYTQTRAGSPWHGACLQLLLAYTRRTRARRAQDFCTPAASRRGRLDAVTEEDLLLYVLLSSNLALGYSVIL